MYKKIENDDLNKQILDSSLFYKLDYCYDSCFFLEILIKKTKDDKCVYCGYYNYTDYNQKPKEEFTNEMEEFVKLIESNKKLFLNYLEIDAATDTNIEVIIECTEAYEGTRGLLIVII